MTIPFNKSRAKEFAKTPALAEGHHALVVTDAQPHQSKNEENDNIMARLTLRKILDPTDGDSIKGPTASLYVTFPLDNPDIDGHEAPQWSGRMFSDFAASVNEEVPKWPKYDKDTKQTFFEGEPIQKGDVQNAYMKCINASGAYASELWGDDGMNLEVLVGSIIYALVSYKNDSDFPSVDNLNIECPDEWVITDDINRSVDDTEEEKPARKSSKKKAKKKARRR